VAGGFEIGVLLGAYGGGQSLEHVSSWALQTVACSFSIQTSDVHSSAYSAKLEVYSRDSEGSTELALRYQYAVANDAYERWSSEVNTHAMVSYAWARIDTAANSGNITVRTGVSCTHLGYSASPTRYRLGGNISSASGIVFDVYRDPSVDSYAVYLDDVLTVADVINLTPDLDVFRGTKQHRQDAKGLGGTYLSYAWGEEYRWTVQVRYMPDSERNLLNRWWKNGWPVMFTWDGSDTSQTFVGVLDGQEPPVQQLMAPYGDLWAGTIRVTALGGSLVF